VYFLSVFVDIGFESELYANNDKFECLFNMMFYDRSYAVNTIL